MRKKTADEESFQTTLVAVTKEMASCLWPSARSDDESSDYAMPVAISAKSVHHVLLPGVLELRLSSEPPVMKAYARKAMAMTFTKKSDRIRRFYRLAGPTTGT